MSVMFPPLLVPFPIVVHFHVPWVTSILTPHRQDNELVIYDAEGGIIWSCPGAAPVNVRKATAEEMNTVYTEFQQDGTLVQYAEKTKGWGGRNREELWRSHSSKCGPLRKSVRNKRPRAG